MGCHEANSLQVFKDCEIIWYSRYVDDVICSFNSGSVANKFYEFLNKKHPNIKFTFEKQQNNFFFRYAYKNQFLKLCATIFREKATIGLFTNSLSFTPLSYKICLVKTVIIVLLKFVAIGVYFTVKLKSDSHLP